MLLSNPKNELLLGGLFASEYDVSYGQRATCAVPEGTDLCIVDGVTLDHCWDTLVRARASREPVLLPVLLLADRAGVGLITRDLWRVVDDVITRPIEKGELRARVRALIRARRLSVQLREMSQLYAHERRIALRLQEAALPRAFPRVPSVAFDGFYRPGSDDALVGGDWYDVVRLPDGRIVFSVGDVSGSGLEAAVTMAAVRQVVRGVAQIHPDPAMILDAADRTLQQEDPGRVVTAFVGVVDPVTATLHYACAGHPPPLVRYAGGEVAALACAGLPLGITTHHERSAATAPIPPDTLLVVFTDGLTEATRDADEGERRLRAALADAALVAKEHPAAALAARVLDVEPRDDVAIFTVRTAPAGSGDGLVRWTFDVHEAVQARRVAAALADLLASNAATEAEIASAQVVLSELLGNVLRYAPGEVDVVVDATGTTIVLHVLDRGRGFAHVPRLPPDIMSEHGRGLYIVAELTDEFHVARRPGGGSHARAVLTVGGVIRSPLEAAP